MTRDEEMAELKQQLKATQLQRQDYCDSLNQYKKLLTEQVAYGENIISSFNTLHSTIARYSCEMLGEDGERYVAIEIPAIGGLLDDVEIDIDNNPSPQLLNKVKAKAILCFASEMTRRELDISSGEFLRNDDELFYHQCNIEAVEYSVSLEAGK